MLPHPEWIGEDADESAAMIQALLDQGAIARKADVDSGDVTIPAESAVDELGQLRPVEQRPPTVLMKINRLRELNREGPIQNETYGPGGKPLVMREVQPIDARTLMPQSELVPAARQVR